MILPLPPTPVARHADPRSFAVAPLTALADPRPRKETTPS